MSETRSLPLRILYTINGSPQYILARSILPCAVQSVILSTSSEPQDDQQAYGTVSLRSCLETICRSSPELMQYSHRDYSVYVLDPLESVSASASLSINGAQGSSGPNNQQAGVAIALGLLSWALVSEESKIIAITGTLINRGSPRESLEVIFSLRETPSASSFQRSGSITDDLSDSASSVSSVSSIPQKKRSGSVLSPLSLAKARAKGLLKPTPVPVKPKAPQKPMTSADLLMASGITYTGPPKKKGRPAKSDIRAREATHAPSTTIDPVPSLLSRTASSSSTSRSNRKATNKKDPGPLPPPFATTPLPPRPPPGPSLPPPTLLDILHNLATSPTSDSREIQTAALLQALSAIDSTMPALSPDLSRSASNPALVDALKQLISASVKDPSATLAPSGPSSQSFHTSSEPASQINSPTKSVDDEIVVLDKENVNPTAFRRRAERERADAKLLFLTGAASGSSNPSPSADPVDGKQSGIGLSSGRRLSNRVVSSSSNAPSPIQEGDSGTLRKRRLSGPADEANPPKRVNVQSESRRLVKKTTSTPENGRARLSSSQSAVAGPSNSDTRQFLKRSASSDPMRHYARLSYVEPVDGQAFAAGNERHYDRVFHPPSSPVHQPQSLDSVIKSSPPKANNRNGSPMQASKAAASASSPPRSATSPRLRPKKKYILPEWAKTNTATQPRLSEEAQKALADAAAAKETERQAKRRGTKRVRKRTSFIQQDSEASEFSGSEAAPKVVPPSKLASSSSMHAPPAIPVTASASFPVFGGKTSDRPRTPPPHFSSTDAPVTPPRRMGESDALFTPTPKARGPATPLFSPFGAFGSPVPKGRVWSQIGLQSVESKDEDTIDDAGVDADAEMADFLSEELDDISAESPPDSLPIASSDTECEDATSTNTSAEVMQHWEGLPPSSPPPPSSPFDLPQVLPPESSTETTTPEPDWRTDTEDNGLPSLNDEMTTAPTTPTITPDDLAMYFDFNDMTNYFSNPDDTTLPPDNTSPLTEEDTAALFNQFTNFSSDSLLGEVTLPTDTDLSAAALPPDIDLMEFWRSMQPLVQSNLPNPVTDNTISLPSEKDQLHFLPPQEDVDHEKLAQEVHALLSGCLT